MPNEMLPMSTWTPKDGQTYEIVDAEARERMVKSVNSIEPDSSGNVSLSANDVGAGTYSKPSGGIPASDLASNVQTSLGKADTALQTVPVQSVNNKTGAVVLSASDVHALPSSYVAPVTSVNGQTGDVVIEAGGGEGTVKSVNNVEPDASGNVTLDIPSKTSELQNDSGFLTQHQSLAAYRTSADQDIIDAAQNTAIAAKYTKPSGGIPKTDLASAVQTSLGKADTALQSHQSLAAYRTSADQDTIDEGQDQAIAAKYTKPSGGIPASDLAAGVIPDISGKLDTTGNAYRSVSIPYGEVDSTSTATVFTVTVPGIAELRDGVCAYIKNGKVTSASGCTLNVNGLGAKPIYQTMAATTAVTTTFNVNYTMLFIYNSTRVSGGCWDMYYGYNANTTYTNASLGQGYATCTTAAATLAKAASLSSYALTTGGIVAVKFSYDVPANATLNVNSKGAKAIYHRGAAITNGIIKAGDVATFIYSAQYHLLSVDRWGVDIADLDSRLDALTVLDEEVF